MNDISMTSFSLMLFLKQKIDLMLFVDVSLVRKP